MCNGMNTDSRGQLCGLGCLLPLFPGFLAPNLDPFAGQAP